MAIGIIVCDRSTARVLRSTGVARTSSVKETATLVSPQARLRPRDFASDRPGRTFGRKAVRGGTKSGARSGIETNADPRAIEAQRFAKRISRRLDIERRAGTFDSLIIVSAPRFLGELRKSLSGPTQALVRQEIPRDWIHMAPEEILQRVREGLP